MEKKILSGLVAAGLGSIFAPKPTAAVIRCCKRNRKGRCVKRCTRCPKGKLCAQ